MEFSALTFNVLYDGLEEVGAPWRDRVDDVASLIRIHRPTLVGLQECWMGQSDDLQSALSGYEWFGENRDVGQHTPVAVRESVASIRDAERFWLAPDPDDRRPAWDATLPRLATHASVEIEDADGGTETVELYNVHLDVDGPRSRVESTEILGERAGDHDAPVVLTGDCNCLPGSEPYRILTEGLRDARHAVDDPHGPFETYHGYEREESKRIDYVFGSGDLRIVDHGVLTDLAEDWLHPSDHWPVLARFALPE